MEEKKKLKDRIVDKAVDLVDENENDKIDLEDFIVKALRLPGIKVDREEFLRDALKKHASDEAIEIAVENNPAKAGIDRYTIERIANESILFQKAVATAASTGLGYVPGAFAVDVATTVADIAQYYGNLLVIIQKLLYLYGYQDLHLDEDENGIDDGMMNMIVICLGVMAGVEEASKFLIKISDMLAKGIPAQIIKNTLTKKVPFQIAYRVLDYMGIKVTQEIVRKGIGNVLKFAGGAIVGGITFVSFTTCCNNFKTSIMKSVLSDTYFESGLNESSEVTEEEVERELEDDFPVEGKDE